MLLVIDVGNTNTVFAAHDGTAFRGSWRCRTLAARTADEYFVWLERLLQIAAIDPHIIDAVMMASVVPAADDNLRRLASKYFNTTALAIRDPGCTTGIEIRVPRPAEVGADRIANAVGAGLQYGPDLIVVDFGTATTFDIVDADGAYAGGVIAPGIGLSLDTLHRAAANLPRIDVKRPETVVGTGTVPAMRSGIYWGYLSLIDGICARIRAERNCPMRGIATGGLAPLFEGDSTAIDIVDLQLTIQGLVEIHLRSTAAP